jgi:predicted TIM-barrel fold metal-dependent hydrolase
VFRIDAHQHLWDPAQFGYAWLPKFPTLNRRHGIEDYLEAARGLAIERTVYLETDVDEPFMLDEARHILAFAEDASNPLAGVVAACRPENADFPEYVEKIAGHPKLKGLRRILHVVPDEIGERPIFAENLRRLPDYGLSFDLCFLARQLPIAIRLVKSCPRVSFILDHCGNPRVKEREIEPWRGYVRELASYPNIVCKISGLVTNAEPHRWTTDDLRPFVETLIECFGWERVMFGSDWPVMTLHSTLGRWVEALDEIVSGATGAQREALYRKNAERVYRLK